MNIAILVLLSIKYILSSYILLWPANGLILPELKIVYVYTSMTLYKGRNDRLENLVILKY